MKDKLVDKKREKPHLVKHKVGLNMNYFDKTERIASKNLQIRLIIIENTHFAKGMMI